MALASVNIAFSKGNLGIVKPSEDGIAGLLCKATAEGTLKLNEVYRITSLAELMDMNITASKNSALITQVGHFYSQAPTGSILYILPISESENLSDAINTNKRIDGLMQASNYSIRLIGEYTKHASGGTGIKEYIDTMSAEKRLFLFVAAYNVSSSFKTQDIVVPTDDALMRSVTMIGSLSKTSQDADIGLLLGRLAAIPVHQHIGRVKDGPVSYEKNFYCYDTPITESYATEIAERGVVTMRRIPSLNGWYFTDDCTRSEPTSDYNSIARVRTIDKAARIAYRVLTQRIFDEVPTNPDGTISAVYAKDLETELVGAIFNEMTLNGNLGTDDPFNDKGVEVTVDTSVNIVSTSTLKLTISVRPYGYAKFIETTLGFNVPSNKS